MLCSFVVKVVHKSVVAGCHKAWHRVQQQCVDAQKMTRSFVIVERVKSRSVLSVDSVNDVVEVFALSLVKRCVVHSFSALSSVALTRNFRYCTLALQCSSN